MKHKRKLLTACSLTLALALSQVWTGFAQTETIHQTSETQTLTQGVTRENIEKFTTKGWLNINILRVDMTNPYINVDTLTNTDSAATLTTAKKLASINGAIASVNASFFTPIDNGQGIPIGPIEQSGEIVSAGTDFNTYGNVMGSFALSNLNEAFYGYWKTTINLTAPNGSSTAVGQINKPSSKDYTDLTVINSKWSKTSVGVTDKMPDIVEMLVVDNVVAGIYTSQPAVQIPGNGYVIVTRKDGGDFLQQNFKVGDAVVLDVLTTPDWKNLKMSVTGGSLLVKDGTIPAEFSFSNTYISKSQPRTAVGSTRDGKQLILVTVDGRQDSSIGMTQKEIAEYMLSLGAYNALNLDGGGSTTMVTRTPGTSSLEVVNSPSDGGSRGVSNAIGIYSTAPASPLAGLIIDTPDKNVFVNTSRTLSVRGYDKYNNPVDVDPSTVKWSVSGVSGSFNGSTFHPTSVGDAKITAKIGSVSKSITLSSLSSPVKLVLNKSTLKLALGHYITMTVTGYNKNGYFASISPEDLKWSTKGNIGELVNGKFTANARGTGYIEAYTGNVHSYCAVSVAADVSIAKNGFEAVGGKFVTSPEAVTGSFVASAEQKHSGNASGKLTYDFSSSIEGSRSASYIFANGGIKLDAGTSKIGLWVYNDHENTNWLSVEVVDAAGAAHTVYLAKNLGWNGWQQVEGSLDGITAPAKLTKICLAQNSPVNETGSIYIDDLSFTISGYPAIDMAKIPVNTQPVDDARKDVSFTRKTSTSFRFAVYGQSYEPKTDVEKLLVKKLSDKINKSIDAAVITGGSSHNSFKSYMKTKKPLIAGPGYSYTDISGSRLINLDASAGGLRASSEGQWSKFLYDLSSFKGNNIFIFLPCSPDSFSDKMEAQLLKDTLSDYKLKSRKNVWVFYNGNANESSLYRGVRYISTMGYNVPGLKTSNASSAPYILVTVKGSTVTYNFKPAN